MRVHRRRRWYWQLDTADARGWSVHVRCLVPASDSTGQLAAALKTLGDRGRDLAAIRRTLLLTLADTLNADPATRTADVWTIYPSSDGTPKLATTIAIAGVAFGLFPGRYLPDLLVRHRPAVRSSTARRTVGDPGFTNQTNTVLVNPAYVNEVYGKQVVVLDDFCTRGHSLECARLLLLAAQARRVDGVTVGHYGTQYTVRTLRSTVLWEPWRPAWLTTDVFVHTVVGASGGAAHTRLRRIVRALWATLLGLLRFGALCFHIVVYMSRCLFLLLSFVWRFD